MAGRKPKPTALKKLEGNPGKRKLNTKEPLPGKGMCRAVTRKEVAMKRYTGNLVIELEDQNTGVKETVSETNMVTNAVNDILGVNPMGVMYKGRRGI